MATILSSLKEAGQVLKGRGIDIDVKKIQEITVRYGRRAEIVKQNEGIEVTETMAGCRVVISTDGGRIRIRKNKRGPKTRKGRSRYTTKWREPKLLIIYMVNDKGEMERSFLSFIEIFWLTALIYLFALLQCFYRFGYYLAKIGKERCDIVSSPNAPCSRSSVALKQICRVPAFVLQN